MAPVDFEIQQYYNFFTSHTVQNESNKPGFDIKYDICRLLITTSPNGSIQWVWKKENIVSVPSICATIVVKNELLGTVIKKVGEHNKQTHTKISFSAGSPKI